MSYITDYQLDIERGFLCKLDNGHNFLSYHFHPKNDKYYVGLLQLAKFIGVPKEEFIGIFNSKTDGYYLICDSKQQCYDLCQHIVDTYFRPNSFRKNDEEFDVNIDGKIHTFYLTKVKEVYLWKSDTRASHVLTDHISLNDTIAALEKLNIKSIKMGCSYTFRTKEDAVKFAKYILQHHYPKKDNKSWQEKSRRHLLKYYTILEQKVHFPERTFQLRQLPNGTWYWHNLNVQVPSRCIFSQFSLSSTKVLDICNNLGILASLSNNTVVFETTLDAIKFTDYLLETYIINKKEKDYDTNQLRKERTTISRGGKPAGGIIHGRRSKASVRCGCIEHKACFGS